MKSKIYVVLIISGITFLNSCSGKKSPNKVQNNLNTVQTWFTAWDIIGSDVLNTDSIAPVDFVLFDDSLVFSTSKITIRNGSKFQGPHFKNQLLVWMVMEHKGQIMLPDGQVISPSLSTFAAPGQPGSNKAYFVMPLPGYWQKAGVKSDELGLGNLLTGIFLHEFSHSQQMKNFGKQLSILEHNQIYKTAFTDNIIQDYFENDSTYVNEFKCEVKLFYEAVLANTVSEFEVKKVHAVEALMNRQQRWYVNEYKNFKKIDDFFLTMEGMGQYLMYRWLIHPKGGNISAEKAIAGVRRGGKNWSQDEGFALFLVAEKMFANKKWQKQMFQSIKPANIIDLIPK